MESFTVFRALILIWIHSKAQHDPINSRFNVAVGPMPSGYQLRHIGLKCSNKLDVCRGSLWPCGSQSRCCCGTHNGPPNITPKFRENTPALGLNHSLGNNRLNQVLQTLVFQIKRTQGRLEPPPVYRRLVTSCHATISNVLSCA